MQVMRGSRCTSFQLTLEDKLSQVMSTWVTRLDWHYIRIISTGQASIIMGYTGQIDKMGEMSLKYCPPNLNRSLFMSTMWIIRFYQVFKPKIAVTVALNDRYYYVSGCTRKTSLPYDFKRSIYLCSHGRPSEDSNMSWVVNLGISS